MNIRRHITAGICALLLMGCTSSAPGHGVYLLLDTSGTYTQELAKAQNIINYILGTLNSGDSLASPASTAAASPRRTSSCG
ncbi:MAG: hypothetical protein OEY97_08860 [Nitrospirota bacterium]|nr:hypothetical protein [Nitrospirota bacterium]